MKTERRWLKSAIAASAEPQIAMPWDRSSRRRPAAMKAESLNAQPSKLIVMTPVQAHNAAALRSIAAR